ncbi:MAG: hypothetical protein GXP26_00435 [Planctomycetes bacterium]|nr:hypothetical protein [Planctomycetota bacterium]
MKNWGKLPLTAALVVITTLIAGSASATTITAGDIQTAAGGGFGNYGVTSLTVGGVAISSTLPSGSPANLGGFISTTGVVGNGANAAVGGDEAIEFNFSSLGSVVASSFTVRNISGNDLAFFLEGFSSDPGASLSVAGFTPSYNAGTQTLQIAVDGGLPIVSELILTFANSVAVSSLTLSNPVFNGSANGVSFNEVVFAVVPEPTGGALFAIAIFGLACFSRRSRG